MKRRNGEGRRRRRDACQPPASSNYQCEWSVAARAMGLIRALLKETRQRPPRPTGSRSELNLTPTSAPLGGFSCLPHPGRTPLSGGASTRETLVPLLHPGAGESARSLAPRAAFHFIFFTSNKSARPVSALAERPTSSNARGSEDRVLHDMCGQLIVK